MLDNWQRLTFYPLKWIFLGGLHPDCNSFITKILFLYNYVTFGVILTLAIVQIFISYQDNIYETIDSILTIVLYLHVSKGIFKTTP